MSTALQRTFGTPTNNKIFTLSLWLKRAASNTNNTIPLMQGGGVSRPTSEIVLNSEAIALSQFDGAGYNYNVRAYYKARDVSAWYHIVYIFDSTQSTASDRVKFYMNGVLQNYNMQNTDYPTLNYVPAMNGATSHAIGGSVFGAFSGSAKCIMSHIHFTDGTAYDPSYFGETDSTTGEWKIKTDVSVTYGNNGFFILKDDNSVTDQSGEGNNWTVGAGTLTKTEDNPSNVFCTWNSNYRGTRKDMTLTNGNTFIFEQNSGDSAVSGTIAVSSGKYYWEQIIAQVNGTNAAVIGGLHTTEDFNESPTDALSNNTCGMRANGNVYKNGSNLGNFTTADPNGDIFGIGFDADNGSVYFWRNGTALNSGNAIITGLDMTKTWIPFGVQHGGARVTTSTNFGNGYFQTTAISSAGTNASGNGIFEYDVPTGYTALSTKGLNL